MKQNGWTGIIAVSAVSTSFGRGTTTSWVDRDVILTEVRDREGRIVACGHRRIGQTRGWVVSSPAYRR